MNQEDIFKKIGHIINELNDQYQYLAQNPRELNELELELFLANASFLTDHVQILRKINNTSIQKALPEHAEPALEENVQQPLIAEVPELQQPEEMSFSKPALEEEIFKLDNTPSNFEFILNDKPSSDRFEFEEKPIDEIFDRPLSREEELIIAQKQKLREKDSLEIEPVEEDEIGPEPFLVTEPLTEIVAEPVMTQQDAEEATPELTNKQETIPEAEPVIEEEPETTLTQKETDEDTLTTQHAAVNIEQEEIIPVFKPFTQEELFTPSRPKPEPYVPPLAETFIPDNMPAEIQPKSTVTARPTLNDILSAGSSSRNTNESSNKPAINDLKQAISLNDKMRYIKDLFNGYNLAYAEVIDLLNKMPDFKSADSFLQHNYAVKNNWAAKQDTVDQFYELLNQRFPAAK